jgi:hypothetical protein
MKKIFLALFMLLGLFSMAFADSYVNGYTKSDGTQVQGYYRSSPNSTRNDNYSTQGNVNPYTGVAGTQPRDNYYNNSGSSYYGTNGKSSSYYSH